MTTTNSAQAVVEQACNLIANYEALSSDKRQVILTHSWAKFEAIIMQGVNALPAYEKQQAQALAKQAEALLEGLLEAPTAKTVSANHGQKTTFSTLVAALERGSYWEADASQKRKGLSQSEQAFIKAICFDESTRAMLRKCPAHAYGPTCDKIMSQVSNGARQAISGAKPYFAKLTGKSFNQMIADVL